MKTWHSLAILEISIGSGWQMHYSETNGFWRGKLSLFYALEYKFSLQCFSIYWKLKYHCCFTKPPECVRFKVQAPTQIIPSCLRQNGVFWPLDDFRGFWGQILGRARSSRHGLLGDSWVALLLLLFPRNSGNSERMQSWLPSTAGAFHWHVAVSEALPKVWRIQWWPPSVWQALASSPN